MLISVENQKTAVQNGFTLIELMIAVSILGILAALAMPSYRVWIENTRIRNAAESIQTGLQKARVEALKRNSDVRFVLGANSAWSIGCVVVNARCPDPIETRGAKEGSSASVSITATPAAATTSVFTNLGRVRSVAEGAATAPFTRLDIDSTSLSAADSRELRILIDAGGAGRQCDPYAGLSASDPRKCP